MIGISILFFGLVVLMTNFVWNHLRFIGPYLKLPSSSSIFLQLIKVLICNLVKTGHVKKIFLRELDEVCRKFQKEGMFLVWFNQPMVCIFRPEFMKQILHEPAAVSKPNIYNLVKYFYGKSVFLSNHKEYTRRKIIVKQAFQFALREKKFQIMNKQSRNLVKILSSIPNNTTNEILDILRHSTLQIIIESLFDIEKNYTERSLILEGFEKIYPFAIEKCVKPWLKPDFSLQIFPEGRQCLKSYKTCKSMISEMVETMKENMLTSNENVLDTKPELIGEALLIEHLKDPSFTMEELIQQLLFLIFAAFDTTALTMMFCLHLIGLHEEVQERILLEVEELNEDLCKEDLSKMEYTECVIRETLRLHSIVPITSRYLSKEVQCGKYTIPKGTTIILPLYILHKNSEMFPDPEKFDPERFRKTENGDSRQLFTAAFSEGFRPCLGKADALNELKIMIAYIVRNFKVVSLDKQKDVEDFFEVMLNVFKPLNMQFIPRRVITDDVMS